MTAFDTLRRSPRRNIQAAVECKADTSRISSSRRDWPVVDIVSLRSQ
jgi:hypothetical protein